MRVQVCICEHIYEHEQSILCVGRKIANNKTNICMTIHPYLSSIGHGIFIDKYDDVYANNKFKCVR